MIDMDVARATHLKLRGKKCAVVFRHDDGWYDTADFAPVYAAHGVNASWFITTDFIGEVSFHSGYHPGGIMHLTEAELQSLYAAGHEIGAHSVTHARFDTLTADQRRTELLDAAEVLEGIIGGDYVCETWAYPGNVVVPAEAHEVYLAGTGDNLGLTESLHTGPVDIHNFGAVYGETHLIDHASLAATTTKTTATIATWKANRTIAIVQIHGAPEASAAELDAVLDVLVPDPDVEVLTFRELVHWIRGTWHTNDGRNYRPARPLSVRSTDLLATPTKPDAPAKIGDFAFVNGVAKVCTVAGTPGTWQTIGAQG